MKKPLIGLTAFYNADSTAIYKINQTYVAAVLASGGIPVLIPNSNEDIIPSFVEMLDGLLIPGGQDVAPSLYGEEPVPQVTYYKKKEDLFEIALVKAVYESGKPIFGICRGEQVINVAFGGSLYQDIPSQTDSNICHTQSVKIRSEDTHWVDVTPTSELGKLFGEAHVRVNSFHHQSVKDVAPGFVVSAVAADGIIEAIESENGQVIAVQWHPEEMCKDHLFKVLFDSFIEKCK